MAESTWESHAIPIVEAIARLETAHMGAHSLDVATETGLDADEVAKELFALLDGRYVSGRDFSDAAIVRFIDLRPLERGKVLIGQWPGSDAFSILLDRIDQALASASPQESTRLRALKDALISVGARIGGSILGDVVRDVLT
jgi:hypothetical protein